MPDYLSCGSCPVDFELADIVSFIEHKRQRCVDGSVDSDQLECFKCSKRFHTPWPLLFHIQVDHKILIVRNLDQISLPLNFKATVASIVQSDEPASMEIDPEDFPKTNLHRDMCTQTLRSRITSCCQPINLPPCCQKIEPQCFDEPCLFPTPADVICTSLTCYINHDNKSNKVSENGTGACCACPQSSNKKESREVQTDFEYTDDLDISFLLSNNPDSARDFTNTVQPTVPFGDQQYSRDFSIPTEKNWGYYTQSDGQLADRAAGTYIPNYEDANYQVLMPGNRRPSNPNLSLTSSPNNSAPNTDNSGFPSLTSCTNEHPLANQNPFQESNNSFHYKGLNGAEPQSLTNTLLMPNSSPTRNESSTLFTRNENCSLSFIQSGSDLSAEFNTENYENEKTENDGKEFRFLCPSCGKRFRQKVHLRKHIMSQHARQKPHKCSQCGYTTVEKSHLTVHIRTHTGERPYTCRRCSYSSAQNCTLKSHYLRRHPGDQIECNLCSSFFITEQERNNHQRSCRIVNGVPNSGNLHQNSDRMDSYKTA